MNNKTIFVVRASGGKGKTGTLRAAANHLLASHLNFTPVDGAASIVPSEGDFRIVVGINQKIIAVESAGDPHTQLRERLEELVHKFKADIILCSSRTKGDTVDAVNAIQNNYGFETIITSTYQVSRDQQNAANVLKGRHIIDLLQDLDILQATGTN